MDYEGKEICQGCKRTGSESPRPYKNELCYSCGRALKIGMTHEAESSIEYANVFQHYFAYSDKGVKDALFKVLGVLNVETANGKGVCVNIRHSFGNNGLYFKIDKRLIEPLTELFEYMSSRIRNIEQQEKEIPKKAQKEVEILKDKIFNDGIKRGKQLLFMLNSGEISVSDFADRIEKYKH